MMVCKRNEPSITKHFSFANAMPLDFMKTTDRGWVLTSIEAWVVEDGQLRKTPKTTMTGQVPAGFARPSR